MAGQAEAVTQNLLTALEGNLVELFADAERVRDLGERAGPFVDPQAEVIFHGTDGVVLEGYRGVDGLVKGWREWLSSFSEYRIEPEDLLRDGDRVIVLVRQVGRTIHGGVEVPSAPSAAVFTLRDGRLARLAFYLDRSEAAAAEGFELPS